MKTRDIIVGDNYAYSQSTDKTVEKFRHLESMWPNRVLVLEVGLSRPIHHEGRMVGFYDSYHDDGIRIKFLDTGRSDIIVPPVHIRRPWAEQEAIHDAWRAEKKADDETQASNREEALKARQFFESMDIHPEIPIHGRRFEIIFVGEDARTLVEMVEDWLT